MAKIYRESDVKPDLLLGLNVGVVGYGNQGRAQALNLRDRELNVAVGLRDGSPSHALVQEDSLPSMPIPELALWADVIALLMPDIPMGEVFHEQILKCLKEGQLLLFAHGFNIQYGMVQPPKDVDVVLVAPIGPGKGLRQAFLAGGGLPAYVAVHQDATGKALLKALCYGWAIGCAKVGLLETSFKEETETDLFGEQAVVCGGLTALVQAGFETLVEAGYQPEVAYFECVHQIKALAELITEGGVAHLYDSISETAAWGGLQVGPKIIGEASHAAMKDQLQKIQGGAFAEEWLRTSKQDPNALASLQNKLKHTFLEKMGKILRK